MLRKFAPCFSLSLLLLCLGISIFAVGDANAATCGAESCIGKDSCKSSEIGDSCPSGAGTFCLITCNGEDSCQDGTFTAASESGHIVCDGKAASGGMMSAPTSLSAVYPNATGAPAPDRSALF